MLVVHGALNARQGHLTLFLPSPNSPLQPITQNVGRTWCIIRADSDTYDNPRHGSFMAVPLGMNAGGPSPAGM